MQESRRGLTKAKQENHLPQPAGHASFDTVQGIVGHLGCERTLLHHVELIFNQQSQVLLRAGLNPCFAKPLFVPGIAPTHVQDLALGLVELHDVHMGPPLKTVRVPLNGIPFFQLVNRSTQLGVTGKLAEQNSVPLSMLLTKTLNNTGPNTDPSGMPFVTGLHLDIEQ